VSRAARAHRRRVLDGCEVQLDLHSGQPPRYAPDVQVIQLDIAPRKLGHNKATEVAAIAPKIPPKSDRAFTYAALIIIAGVLATTLAQTQVLARLPLQNLLKNELQVDRTANAAFFFWAGLAWYLKPLAGVLTDAFPLFGSRRKSYILLSAALAALAWWTLIITPHDYRKLLAVAIVINAFMVVASTAVGGYMVETAQASSGSGRLTAIRQFIQQASFVINGPVAGYLASIAFGWTAAACGGIMFLLVPVTILFLHERRLKLDSREVLSNAKAQLLNIGTARTMWAAAGLMALFYVAPGFATALFYKQQNELHFSTQTQGFLQLVAGISGIAAAVGYGILAGGSVFARCWFGACSPPRSPIWATCSTRL
jgi:hypothetical protein